MDIFAPLGKALRVSSAASTFIGGGFALLAAAIYLAAYLKDADAASTDPWRVAVYLLGFAVAILALSGLSVMARSLLAWLFTLLFAVYLTAVFLQILTGDRCPWAASTCLLSFGTDPACKIAAMAVDEGTGSGVATVGTAVPGLPATVSEEVIRDTGHLQGFGIGTNDVSLPAATAEEPRPAALPTSATVFVQFAGFVRSDVVDLSAKLALLGWTVEGADRGGQRLAAAAGLREVRYFMPKDRTAAERLARDVATAIKNDISVKDFSATSAAKGVSAGHLEVWISR